MQGYKNNAVYICVKSMTYIYGEETDQVEWQLN